MLQECTKLYLTQPQRKKAVIKVKMQNTTSRSIYLKILLSSCTGIGNFYLPYWEKKYWEFSYCSFFFFLWKKGIMRELKTSREWYLFVSHVCSSSARNSLNCPCRSDLQCWSYEQASNATNSKVRMKLTQEEPR